MVKGDLFKQLDLAQKLSEGQV